MSTGTFQLATGSSDSHPKRGGGGGGSNKGKMMSFGLFIRYCNFLDGSNERLKASSHDSVCSIRFFCAFVLSLKQLFTNQ